MKKIILILSIALLSTTLLFANGSKESAAKKASNSNEPVKMEWLISKNSVEVDENAEVVKMIEEKFNVDLSTWSVDPKRFYENLNVKFAGGDMPDVLILDLASQIPQLVEGGIIAELPIEVIREKAPHFAAEADKQDTGALWSTMVYNGKNYGIACPMEAVPMVLVWRKDWLDRLGLEVPTTLEEFEKVMLAFVNDDPDGDGKKNTAGMAERTFNAIFGAYGLRCVTGAQPNFKVEEMQLGDDNVPFFPWTRPEAKEVLALLNDWYNKGIIDKEFITGERHGGYNWLSHAFMNGQIGVTCAQPYHYLNASTDTSDPDNWGTCMKEFKALNPDADIVFGPAPIGPDGKSGTEGWAKIGRLTVLTTKAAKDPRKVDAFLKMLDAYFSDVEYATLANYGIEGVHFERGKYGNQRLMTDTELRKQGPLEFDFGGTSWFSEMVDDRKTAFGHEVTGPGYWRFNAPPTKEFSDAIANLTTLTQQTYYDIISGAKPVDYFDTFVKQFNDLGGAKAEKAVQEAYAANFIK